MPVAIAITKKTVGATTLQRTALSAGADTLAYVPGTNMQLTLANETDKALSATLAGANASPAYVIPGTGGTSINAAAGKTIGPIPTGTSVLVSLDDLSLYLQGAVTLNGGAGLTATVLSN